jgi:hypothetical protein
VDYAGIILTLVGVIVVGLYTYYTKKQHELTRKTLILSRRAWLIPFLRRPPLITPSDAPYTISIGIENVGGVPGVCLVGNAEVIIAEKFPADVAIAAVDHEPSGMIVVPGTTASPTYFEPQPPCPGLSATECREILEGSKVIIVYCHILYSDVFEEIWDTALGWYFKEGGWFIHATYTKLDSVKGSALKP